MRVNTEKQLELIKEYGYELDFSATFNQAFENYKKIALLVGAIILVLVAFFTIIIGGIAGVFIGIGSYTEFLTGINPANPSTPLILISYFSSVVGAAIIAPLTAGILKIIHSAEINNEFSFSTAFDYFKSNYFKEIFIAVFLVNAIGGAVSTLLNIIKSNYENGFYEIILTIAAALISILVSLFSILTIPSIIFGDLKAVPAIKCSILIISKNWFLIIVLLIVGIIFAMIGFFGFCIGIFFTIPFYYSLQYIIYKTALPIEEKNEIDEIGNSEY